MGHTSVSRSTVANPGPVGEGTSPDVATTGRRVVIESVRPQIDGGRFPIKRTIGEIVSVTADVFADGHDVLDGVLKYRRVSANATWSEVPLSHLGDDRWGASFTVTELGEHEYTVEAWIDRFESWLQGLIAKANAGQDVGSELVEGAALVERFADDNRLLERADFLRSNRPQLDRVTAASDPQLRGLMRSRPDRSASTICERMLRVIVDPVRARFGAWYEMFPRSCTSNPARSGTFREAEARLPDIAAMGFDVVYLAPIHPIGRTHRKGRNNALTSQPDDPGSPWAIGAAEGGHTAIEPGLGTLEDFDRFVATASHLGLDLALDIAFQASPDHPWVREHPEWFKHRPDGSIKYAENPPKKYKDIYPLDFDSSDRASLWLELRDVFRFWIAHGVKIFRVDNPHTKPFRFWEWCIAEIKRDHPDAIFLSEAFTRPKVMQRLAKSGFTQSYTYFTWRNSARELRDYLTELTSTEVAEYLRPNFFANTPDILHEYLQHGGKPAFEVRLVLAATLAASYGIYSGFELCENVAVRPGSEEYLDSEKYQIKPRDWNQPGHLKELIARVNTIRRQHPALQQNATLRFHQSSTEALLWFSKTAALAEASAGQVRRDVVFVVANTTPAHMQHGWIEVPIDELGIPPDASYEVEDLLDSATYTWRGAWNYVRLDPAERMAHIFVIRRPPQPQETVVPAAMRTTAPVVDQHLAVPSLAAGADWDATLDGSVRTMVENQALVPFLLRQRWFGGKARPVAAARFLDWATLRRGVHPAVLSLVDVQYRDGGSDRYALPLAMASGADADDVTRTYAHAVVSSIVGAREGVLYDGLFDAGVCGVLLDTLRQAGEITMRHGRILGTVQAAPDTFAADKTVPPVDRRAVDQSNTSVIFGRQLIMKMFRRLEPGVNPDVEIGSFLTSRGFSCIPPLLGTLSYEQRGTTTSIVMLQRFVPNQGNAWDVTLEDLSRYFERVKARASHVIENDAEVIGPYLSRAELLGRRTGELHVALGSARPTESAFSEETYSAADVAATAKQMRQHASAQLQLLKSALPQLDDGRRQLATELLARADDLGQHFGAMTHVRSGGARIRCHGDYHLGQVLIAEAEVVILDFEGEPARPVAERREKSSPLRDVAGMIRSFSYAALTGLGVATHTRPGDVERLSPWARLWEAWVSAAFRRAYFAATDGTALVPRDPNDFDALLRGFVVEKALYELAYELNNRPDWVHIPLLGLLNLGELHHA